MAENDKKSEQHADQEAEPPVNADDGIIDMDDLTDGGASQEAEADSDESGEESEVHQLKDRLIRTLAELENTRKRAERDIARKFAIADFARDLLSASDNLRRAVESAPEDRYP